jgi:hypothetical protein
VNLVDFSSAIRPIAVASDHFDYVARRCECEPLQL